MYSDKIKQIFTNPKNVGILQNASGVAQYVNPKTNDILKLYIKIENGMIIDASFKSFAGIMGVVVLSEFTEMLKYKTIEDALNINETEIEEYICEIPENKKYLLTDAIEVLKLTVQDYTKKLEKELKKHKKIMEN